MGFISGIVVLVVIGFGTLMFFVGYDYGTSKHEAIAKSHALERAKIVLAEKDQDLIKTQAAKEEGDATIKRLTVDTDTTIANIEDAHAIEIAQTKRERDRHAADADSTKTELAECRAAPKGERVCHWSDLLPPLPE